MTLFGREGNRREIEVNGCVGPLIWSIRVAGEVYRGQLLEAEDNMNCYIGSVTMTARDGRTSKLEQVALRGSQVCSHPP